MENSSSLFKLQNVINPNDKSSEKIAHSKKFFTITSAPYELKVWDVIPVWNKNKK